MSALALKILLEGNMGDHKKLHMFFFVQLCLELLCNEDTVGESSLEMMIGNCVCVSALPLDLKILSWKCG